MARLLVCAATPMEVAACPFFWTGAERLVSGVGIPATLVSLLTGERFRSEPPALILNIGIAGAYPGTGLEIGDIVLATGENWGDLGMELPEAPGFLPLGETPWGIFCREPLPLTIPEGFPPGSGGGSWMVHQGRGCTVNTCTGTWAAGERRKRQFQAVFESMEGAAVALAGKSLRVPVAEVRAISNLAAERDMRPENIQRALQNLSAYLVTTHPPGAVSS